MWLVERLLIRLCVAARYEIVNRDSKPALKVLVKGEEKLLSPEEAQTKLYT